jgi:cellulose synthase/poly-beta-1,6-N-acetylglucosamine synthase-like glycosyltransferase
MKNKKPTKRTRYPRPLVSVVMAAYNEEVGITACLESIKKNTYKKIEVIIIDNGSADNTKKLVKEFIKKRSSTNFRLVARKGNYGKGDSITYGIKKFAKGELVMTLDADTILDKNAIKNAIVYFRDPKVQGIAANVQVIKERTIINLLQRFEHLVGYRSKKLYSVANCEFIVGGVASTYRREIMKKVRYYDKDTVTEDIGLSLKIVGLGNKDNKIVYAVDVVAKTDGVGSFKALLRQRYRWKMGGLQNLHKNRKLFFNRDPKYSKSLTFYRIPMAYIGEVLMMIEPLVLAYVIYLSIVYSTSELFIGAYMMMVIYILLTVYNDENLSFWQKIKQSTYAPILYFVFYLMSIVQIVSIYRCIFKIKQVILKEETGSTWTSPSRARKLSEAKA